jgi:DNA processing protein
VPDLKVSEKQIREIVSGLAVGDEDHEELFASITWSVWCEPGDGFAGLLTQGLGAVEALFCEINEISPVEVRSRLIDAGRDDDWIEAFGNFESNLLQARARWQSRKALAPVLAASNAHRHLCGNVLTSSSALWPAQLADLKFNQPLALWLRGSVRHLQAAGVSIVGSRNATRYGERATNDLVGALAQEQLSVISGGAYGIDAMAHRAALALKTPTIAVLAGGLDRLYPTGNSSLLERIQAEGLLVSEMEPGVAPSKWRFLQRNRLIAALGVATVVVEANWRSGAINTVTHARALDRPVGAVPGSIESPTSAGCNQLIRSLKAELITSGKELIELVGLNFDDDERIARAGLGQLEIRALDSIGFDNPSEREIIADSGLSVHELTMALGALDLEGLIERANGGWRRRRSTV